MVARLVRDQKVAGSNPVTSTIFDRVCESKSGFFVPLFWSIRTQADMPPFGCDRMTTDKGGLMESRVWFWGAFSVRDVHWQKGVEMSGRDGKKAVPVLKVHDGSIFTYIRFRHIHMQLCLIIQKSCCFIQQFSKKCIISSGDKTLDPSCEGMISHIEDHSTFFIVFGKLSAFWNRWFCRKAGASTPELVDRKVSRKMERKRSKRWNRN